MPQNVLPAHDRETTGIIFHPFVNFVSILHSTLIIVKVRIIFRLMVHSVSSRCKSLAWLTSGFVQRT